MTRNQPFSVQPFLAEHGIGNADVAELFGVDVSTASRLIRGRSAWSVERAIALAKWLRDARGISITVEELFAGCQEVAA